MPSGFLRLKEIARQLQSPSSYPDPSLINSANMCKCCQVTSKVPALVPRIGRPGPFRVAVQSNSGWRAQSFMSFVEYQIWQKLIEELVWQYDQENENAWCQTMPGLKERMQKYVNQSMPSDLKLILVKFWSSSCAICALPNSVSGGSPRLRARGRWSCLLQVLDSSPGPVFGCRSNRAVPCSAVQCHVCFKCDNLFCTAGKMELMPEKLLGTTGHSAIRWHDKTCKRGPCPPDPAFRRRIALPLPFGSKLGKCLWKGRDCIQLLLFNDVIWCWYCLIHAMQINKSLQYKIVQDQYRNPGTGLGTNGPLRKVARWQAHGFAESDVAPASVAEAIISNLRFASWRKFYLEDLILMTTIFDSELWNIVVTTSCSFVEKHSESPAVSNLTMLPPPQAHISCSGSALDVESTCPARSSVNRDVQPVEAQFRAQFRFNIGST